MADKNVNIRDRLLGMSDAQLYEMAVSVCNAAGMDKKKSAELTGNIPRLRRMLSSLSDKQITALLSSVGGIQNYGKG